MSERATDREKSVLQWFCKVFDKYRGRSPEHLSNSIIFVRLRVDFATALTNRHAPRASEQPCSLERLDACAAVLFVEFRLCP